MFDWVNWGRELATMSQTGLTYAKDPFDIARYHRIRELAVAMLAAGSETESSTVARIFDGETGHATPKVDVRAFVLREGRVLLVRERDDGCWSLPGGWADIGESASEAVAREVVEESGYQVRITRLLAVYDREKRDYPPHAFYVYKLFFLGELTGGTATTSSETDRIEFFGRDALPPLSLKRTSPVQVLRLFGLAEDPNAPTDFD